MHVIDHHSVRYVVDKIDHVIERHRQIVNVLTIKRRNERFAELPHDPVRQIIAGVFGRCPACAFYYLTTVTGQCA